MDMYHPNEGGLFSHWPRSFTADSDCKLVVWRRDEFEEFVKANERIEAAAVRAQIDELWGKYFRLGHRLRSMSRTRGEQSFQQAVARFVDVRGCDLSAVELETLAIVAESLGCAQRQRDNIYHEFGVHLVHHDGGRHAVTSLHTSDPEVPQEQGPSVEPQTGPSVE